MRRNFTLVVQIFIFALIAVLSTVLTIFLDRDVPQALGGEARISVVFTEYGGDNSARLALLTRASDTYDLGLYRVLPDRSKQGQQQFVALSAPKSVGAQLDDSRSMRWFKGGTDSLVLPPERLAHSTVAGDYIVTQAKNLATATAAMESQGVSFNRTDTTPSEYVLNVWRVPAFGAPLLAAFGLAASLSVFVLASRAKSRALQTLGGAKPTRIMLSDLGWYIMRLFAAALGVAGVWVAAIALVRGTVFVPMFLQSYVPFAACALAASLALLLLLFWMSRPIVTGIALRKPAIARYRWPSLIVHMLTVATVVVFAGSTFTAQSQARSAAEQLSVWNTLSSQVGIRMTIGEAGFTTLQPRFHELVADAESRGLVTMSMPFESDADLAAAGYGGLVFVNARWLQLVSENAEFSTPLVTVAIPADSPLLQRRITPQLDVWTKPAAEVAQLKFFTTAGADQVFAANDPAETGSLTFVKRPLIVQLPSLATALDQFNVMAMLSSANISFTDFTALQSALTAHNLDAASLTTSGVVGGLYPEYLAENGLVAAHMATYQAQLLTMAFALGIIAFAFAAAANALIGALSNARPDFPMRLAGHTWGHVIARRAAVDLVIVAVVAFLAVFFMQNQPGAIAASYSAIPIALVCIILAHLIATRHVFKRVATRAI